MPNRRDVLKILAAAPLLCRAGKLFAVPNTDTKLLFIFLRGAYDATNVLIPISSSFYYESRPTIAIPRPNGDLDSNSAITLNSDWGLHPALRNTIYPLFQKQQAIFVPFAGTEDLSRSHFETQDSIEMGQGLTPHNYQSGFLNRLVTTVGSSKPIAFTNQLPLIFRGNRMVANISLKEIGKPGIDSRQSALIAEMYKATSLARQVNEGFEVRDEVTQDLVKHMQAASRDAISPKGFELESQRIAQLMGQNFNVGFIDVGGWDTHVGEGGNTGYLASRLEELGKGLSTFASEMGDAWQQTIVVVVSEFGRTFRENGNRGTDHGHGTVYWILGGNIQGGRILGEQISITDPSSLFQNRDYPVLNEYRGLLGGLFAKMYGLNNESVAKIFPNAVQQNISLI